MKNNIILSVLVGVLLVVSSNSCSDALEVDRIGTITPQQMWDDPEFIKYYVNDFYNNLPSWNQESSLTEEAISTTLPAFLRGINTTGDGYPQREYSYDKIRTINVFFN